MTAWRKRLGVVRVRRRARPGHADLRWHPTGAIYLVTPEIGQLQSGLFSASLLCVQSFTCVSLRHIAVVSPRRDNSVAFWIEAGIGPEFMSKWPSRFFVPRLARVFARRFTGFAFSCAFGSYRRPGQPTGMLPTRNWLRCRNIRETECGL